MAGAGIRFFKASQANGSFAALSSWERTSLLFHTPYIMATNSIKLLTGNSHPELAQLVADR
jgi:hypothetical protein